MYITTVTSEIIENKKNINFCDLFRMAQDYEHQILMEELRDEINK